MATAPGYHAPTLSKKPVRLLALGLALLLFHILTMLLLELQWGKPAAPPLAAAGDWHLEGSAPTLLGCILLLRRASRRAGFLLIPLGLLPFFAAIYSPVTLVKAFIPPTPTVLWTSGGAAVICAIYAITLVQGVAASKGNVKATSEWGKAKAMREALRGLIIGRDHDGKLLRYDGDGHLMTVAATRSGKGVGTIIPNLLLHPGSVICTDPKGENYFVTSAQRRKMGQKVVALDPFNLTGQQSNAFNPMDLIDPEDPDSAIEAARSMAENMIGKADQGEAFWVSEGKALLMTFILHVKFHAPPDKHNMRFVRELLSLSPDKLQSQLKSMTSTEWVQTKGGYPGDGKGWGPDGAPGRFRAVIEGANRMRQKQPKEFGSVMSTVQSRTHVFSSENLKAPMDSTTFTKEELLGDTVTVYIIVPAEHLKAYAPWIRLTLVSIYGLITRDAHKRTVKPQHRILFLLDEFANLGKIKEMLGLVSLGAGFGVSLWTVLQDFSQLKAEYGEEWNSFLANSDVVQLFGIQDLFSCQQVGDLLGKTTVWQRRLQKKDRSDPTYTSEIDESERPLLTTDEIRRLHPDRQILLVRPYQPVIANKIRFHKDRTFKHLASPNPLLS